MFLLPSVLLGLVLAVALGGRPARILDVPFRRSGLVALALSLQIALFSQLGGALPDRLHGGLHLVTYGLLAAFALSNRRVRALLPVHVGMLLNGVAIVANGGRMPVSPEAAAAAGVVPSTYSNTSVEADRLSLLGDVFALPPQLPLANVFSIGDILVGLGMVAFIVLASLDDGGEPVFRPRRLLEPLRTPAYRRLAGGKLVSQVGDWLTMAALVGWVYDETRSTSHVAMLLGLRLAPPILGGGVAAVVVDRLRKGRLLVWLELSRGAIVGGALACIVLDLHAPIFALVALSGALAAISATTVPALVPSLLPARQLPAANAALGIAGDGAMALGAFGAGIALSASGTAAALAVDLATFVVAAALYAGIREAEAVSPACAAARGFVAGLRYLLGRRALLVVVLAFSTATLATGLTNATLPGFLGGELGLGPEAYGFGFGALATGLALGQAVVGFSRIGDAAGRWIGLALLLMAGLLALLSLVAHGPTALLLLGLVGLVDGTTDVLFDTAVQQEADPSQYGRVFGFAKAFVTTTLLGSVAAAPLANSLGPPHGVIMFASVWLLVAGGVALAGGRLAAARAVPARVGSR
jgi:hypothetical protein